MFSSGFYGKSAKNNIHNKNRIFLQLKNIFILQAFVANSQKPIQNRNKTFFLTNDEYVYPTGFYDKSNKNNSEQK